MTETVEAQRIRKVLPQRMRERMETLGIDREELARRSGVSLQVIDAMLGEDDGPCAVSAHPRPQGDRLAELERAVERLAGKIERLRAQLGSKDDQADPPPAA